MQADQTTQPPTKSPVDAVIRLALVAILAALCVWIFAPFAGVMSWAVILAVALFPVHTLLARAIGGRQGAAATVVVLVGLVVIGAPSVLLGGSFASQVQRAYAAFENDELTVPAPSPDVAEWPLIGEKIYGTWSEASSNLPAFVAHHKPQLREVARKAVSVAANTLGSILAFMGALVIAGILMAYGEACAHAVGLVLGRVTDPATGDRLQSLSTATVRSVATGVIGVAVIQTLLLGVGFVWADVPAAGVLAFVVLVLGIAQLPATVVTLPVIAYLWWSPAGSALSDTLFTVYLLVAGLSDNVLKPLLLGRGVDSPMPVILIGALGGMVTAGIVGLFVGAVILALGYQVLTMWVTAPRPEGASE